MDKLLLCLLVVLPICWARIEQCPNFGDKCVDPKCNPNRSYCCKYNSTQPPTVRCFCDPGYGGDDCTITIDDPNWMDHSQQDLNKHLNKKFLTGKAKNLILFIGDGMGFPSVTAGRIYKGQQQGKAGEESTLVFDEFPFTGHSKTFAADFQTTDSAGAASAILSGRKCNLGTVGVNEKVKRADCGAVKGNEIENIVDWAQAAGMRVGIVTTTTVTHATPSAMYAASAERFWESDFYFNLPGSDYRDLVKKYGCKDIADQFISREKAKKLHVVLGGGRQHFYPMTEADPEYPTKTGRRMDGRNLVQEWLDGHNNRRNSAKYVWNKNQFDAIDPSTTDYVLGLFERSHVRYDYDNINDAAGEPTLAEMVEKAIAILSKGDKGFFLLVESGRIDHAHHYGMARTALDEVGAFDRAIRKARSITKEEETLTVVTADHSHMMTFGVYSTRGNNILGLQDSIELSPSLDGFRRTTILYGDGQGAPEKGQYRTDPLEDDTHAYTYLQQAAIKAEMATHGGEDVPIYAVGPMAHLLTGVHNQIYISHVMAYAACIGENQSHCDTKKTDPPTPPPRPTQPNDNNNNQWKPSAAPTSSVNISALFLTIIAIVYNRYID